MFKKLWDVLRHTNTPKKEVQALIRKQRMISEKEVQELLLSNEYQWALIQQNDRSQT